MMNELTSSNPLPPDLQVYYDRLVKAGIPVEQIWQILSSPKDNPLGTKDNIAPNG
jgi:hypothetical protein